MDKATIKYYPVGNGDNSLLTLQDKTTILIDCNIRNCDSDEIFDVKADLLQNLQKDNGIPFVDVFVLTHGDQDHCRGFKKHFYQGDPNSYSNKDKDEGLIRVDTMWFSPMIAEQHTNEDEDAYQLEAERRLALHRKGDYRKDLPGNRIRIIGYDGNADYQDLNELRSIPGEVINVFNNKYQSKFSVFIHAPFKQQLVQESDDKKNSTSIVFQARFKSSPLNEDFSSLAIFGGDSDHVSWETILEKTKEHNNESALEWDLFLSPHHCSWSFFNDRPQAENPIPKKTSLDVLDYGRKNSIVIASSKEIKNNDDNPPHWKAKNQYVKKVGEDCFLNTSTYKLIGKTPQPIEFEISSLGIVKPRQKDCAKCSCSCGFCWSCYSC